MKEVLSENLIKLSKAILDKGGRLYIVGGFIRNYLLGLPLDDIDICGAMHFDDVKGICDDLNFQCKMVNKKLGTLLIIAGDEKYEYTPFRTENYLLGKHTPETVEWTDSIEVDAKRRDFTCNALYYDIEDDKFFDFYKGKQDISRKCLRTVETPEYVFSSDGLRILRLLRFACSLDFGIDKRTRKVAYKMRYQLKYISGERKSAELKSIFETSKLYKSKVDYLKVFNDFRIYPYLANMPNMPGKVSLKKYSDVLQKTEDKFTAFLYIILLSKYKNKLQNINQIIYDIQTLVNEILRCGGDIKEMSKTLYVISRLYKEEIPMEICMMYNDLKISSKSIVKDFCDVSIIESKINTLRENNIPLGLDDLKITNLEIMEIVPKETITFVKNLLLYKCQIGVINNEHDQLIKVVKSLKLKTDNKVVEIEAKEKKKGK